MNWLLFALLAPVIYTVVNFTDKYVIAREVPDAKSVPVFLALVHGVVGTLLWLANGFPVPEARVAVGVMASGAFVVCGTFLLFRALEHEETSRIMMWTQMLPVVVLLLSVFVLDETLTVPQFIGFALILSAAIGLSLQRHEGSLRPTFSFVYIMGAVLVWATSDIVLKAVLLEKPQLTAGAAGGIDMGAFLTIINFQSWGFALGGLFFYLAVAPVRHAFNRRIQNTSRFAFTVLFVNESVFVLRQFVRTLAIALGPLALVSVLDGTRIFFGIAAGWLLTRLAPAIFDENITREGLMQKAAFSGVLFAGIVFVFVFGVG